ncbi:hypothetical protein J5N97_019529 [Dioscorea zingiberensis]|uniref:Uncharacterized protein n=1 Tax=Dioscorea zingiberensis TaxID=325984 RepID=A0A9D5CEW3_9LILI|nr:hypothetical protein J5N97_019529 [Dioscorea zingiberensis]
MASATQRHQHRNNSGNIGSNTAIASFGESTSNISNHSSSVSIQHPFFISILRQAATIQHPWPSIGNQAASMQRQAATIQHPGSSIGNQTAFTVFKSASKQHPWSWDSNHLQPVLKQPQFLKQQPLTRAATNSASSCKAFKLAATSGIREFQIRAAERHQVQEKLKGADSSQQQIWWCSAASGAQMAGARRRGWTSGQLRAGPSWRCAQVGRARRGVLGAGWQGLGWGAGQAWGRSWSCCWPTGCSWGCCRPSGRS